MSGAEHEVEAFLAAVSERQGKRPDLSALQAAILVAAEQEIALDSRSFAQRMGLSHAIILRELNSLLDHDRDLVLVRRDTRTMRTFYRLPDAD